MAYFLYNKPIRVETDAFNKVFRGMLLQLCKKNNDWHLIAFWSKIIQIAEYNYHIYNKKLLAIIQVLQYWRLKLIKL